LEVGRTKRWQPTRQQHSKSPRRLSRTKGEKEFCTAQAAVKLVGHPRLPHVSGCGETAYFDERVVIG
jgi:hypothetical protein